MPNAAPGAYSLVVCDRGCTKEVGDLVGAGKFVVVGSPREQTLQIQRLQTGVRHAKRERQRQQQQLTDLNGAVAREVARAEAL